MTSLSQAALWLVNQGAQKAFGPEPRQWLYGDAAIPVNEYRRIVILVVGDYSITVRKAIAKNFEEQAKDAGFRLLKAQPVGEKVQFLESPAYLFTGFIAADAWPKTANYLSKNLDGALVTFDSEAVGPVESASLDALWIAGETVEKAGDVKVEHGLNINYWPLVGGAALVVSAGFLMYTLLSKVFKGAEA